MEENRFGLFMAMISNVNADLQQLKKRYASEFGLKAVHILWMYQLRIHPEGLSAAALAEELGVNRSLVSREIEELAGTGYLEPADSPSRYARRYRLSPAGREKADEIMGIAQGLQDAVNRPLSREELAVFYRVLTTLSHNIHRLVRAGGRGEQDEGKADL